MAGEPYAVRLKLPEAVELLVRECGCETCRAKDLLERTIRDGSLKDIVVFYPDGEKWSHDITRWRDIDWDTGMVGYEPSWSGSPPTILPVIPCLSREEVMKSFGISDPEPADKNAKRGGRPVQHDWDAFWIEVCRRIHEEGVPETRVKLAKIMQNWFISRGDERIDQRTIEKKISDLFEAFGRD